MTSEYLSPGRFEIIAHRGGSNERPENTLSAFEHAYSLYPKIYFELDVHETRNGEIVVIHDNTVDRTTNGHGVVEDLTWSELSKLDCGFHFTQDGGKTFPFRGKGIAIPRLIDILERFPKTFVTIEIKLDASKGNKNFFGHRIIEIINKIGAEKRVCLSGEHHSDLVRTSKLSLDLCSGYSKHELFFDFLWNRVHLPSVIPFLWPNRGQVLQTPYIHNNYLVTTAQSIRRAHARKKFVHVWTINDEVAMRHLINMGVDGIITDAPTLLLKVARGTKKDLAFAIKVFWQSFLKEWEWDQQPLLQQNQL